MEYRSQSSQKFFDWSFERKTSSRTNSQEWESIIEEWESESKERVPDTLKSDALAESAPKAVSEHIRLNADNLDTHKKIKQCALDCVVSENMGPTPMKVGAVVKKQRRHRRKKSDTMDTTRARALAKACVRANRVNKGDLEGRIVLATWIKSGTRWVLQQLLEVKSQVERLLAAWNKDHQTPD